ncbi:hypothetical protein ALC56_09428, partial [Trachymyrmex septentrionalis]
PFAPFATPSLVNVDACSTWSSAECNICLISLCISCTNPYRNSTTSIKMYHLCNTLFYRCHETTGFSQVQINHSTTEGSNAPCILRKLMPPLLRASQIGKGVKLTATYLWRGRDAIRHEDSGSYRTKVAGSGSRSSPSVYFGGRSPLLESMISSAEYLTEDEWDDLDAVSPPFRREEGGEGGGAEQEIPGEKLQAVLNQFTRKALRVVQERNVAARCRRWRSIRPVWLEGRDDMGRGLVQLRGRGDHDTTSLRILADILGYQTRVFTRTVFTRRSRRDTPDSNADGGTNPIEKDLIKAMVIRETVRRMYTRKKLDEMMVVCESFLEHLRVQSQVLVSALELTWPPAGWALCRPSQPPPSTIFRSPYLPDEGGTPRRSNTRVFHFTWTLIVHLCAHWREEAEKRGGPGEGGGKGRTATDVGSEDAWQGEKESKEENRGREEEKGAG